MEGHAPIYIRVQDYDEVLSTVDSVKHKLKDAQTLLAKLNELKADEDREILSWTQGLEEIAAKVASIEEGLASK